MKEENTTKPYTEAESRMYQNFIDAIDKEIEELMSKGMTKEEAQTHIRNRMLEACQLNLNPKL